MNEIDQTVERIGQLVPLVSSLEHWKDNGEPDRGGANGTYETATKEYFGEFCTPDQIAGLQALANAYTQLKADLAIAKQGLMDYADREHWSRYSSATDFRIIWQGSEGEGCELAQQILDALDNGR